MSSSEDALEGGSGTSAVSSSSSSSSSPSSPSVRVILQHVNEASLLLDNDAVCGHMRHEGVVWYVSLLKPLADQTNPDPATFLRQAGD